MSIGNKYWLKEHQITAFWHSFGISNGIDVPREHTRMVYTDKNGHYVDKADDKGTTYVHISQEYMHNLLKDYIQWLERYAKTWHEDMPHPNGINTREAFLKSEESHPSRADILKMIELLQTYRIDD